MTALLLAAVLAAAPAPRLGAGVVIDAPTRGPVVAVLGDVRVSADVVGDVVALGGDVTVAAGGTVRGDVVSIGGRVTGQGKVAGRTVAIGGLAGGLGSVAEGSRPSQALGVALVRVGAWVALAALLMLFRPGLARRAADRIVELSWRIPVVGALALAVWLVVVVLALALTATPLGVACVLLAVAALLAAKALGVVAVAWVLGKTAAPYLPVALRGELQRTSAGMLVLAALSLVPLVGTALWLVVNVAGIGTIVGLIAERRPLALLIPRLAAQ